MKKNKGIIFIIVIAMIITAIIVGVSMSKKSKNNENKIEETATIQGPKIAFNENKLKKSINTSRQGLKVSNFQIKDNYNGTVTFNLDIANLSTSDKNASVNVLFYNKEKTEIGRVEFRYVINAGETKHDESTCFINGSEIANSDVEITTTEYEEPKK